MKRNVLLAVLLAVLVGVAVWLMRDLSDTGSAAATANSTKSEEPSEHEASAVAGEPPRTDDTRGRSAVAATDAPAAPEVPAEKPAMPAVEGDLLEVRVIDRASQKPVSEARVVQFEDRAHRSVFQMANVVREADFDAHFDAAADARSSDVNGIAHVPRRHEPTVIVARFEDSLGLVNVAGDTLKPVVVELVVDGAISMHVVGADGRPSAEAPVALRRRQAGNFNDYTSADADAEGRALLHHAAALIADRPKPLNAWHAALRGVFFPVIEVDVDAALLGGATAELVMPAHGECEVEVLDEQGAPCTDSLSIGLRVEHGGDHPRIGSWFVPDGGARVEEVVTGSQLFRFVQLGSPLEAFVMRTGSEVVHRASGRGPTNAGERTKITVQLGDTACLLTGRALDASRQPLSAVARARMQRHDLRDRIESDGALALAADGRFRFDVANENRAVPRRAFVVYTRDADGHEQLSAMRELPAILDIGVLDLGDLALEPSPMIAVGVALDDRERPLADAVVTVAVDERPEGQSWWVPRGGLNAKTDAQGRFGIRGSVALPDIQVSGTLDGRASEVLTTTAGRTDLVLHFPASGNLAGRLLLDDALSKWAVLIEARRLDAAGDEPNDKRRVTLKQAGEFELRGLRVGTYEVVVSINIVEAFRELARFTDVAVESERTTHDPRLNPLDLRGQLLSFTVRLADAHDAYVPGSWLTVHQRDGPDQQLDGDIGLGGYTTKHAIVCGLAGADVRGGAPGMLDVELGGLKSDATLVLRAGPRVRLVIAPAPALSDRRVYLAARLEPESRPGTRFPTASARFDDSGVAQVAANCIGREHVVFYVGLVDPNRNVERALDASPQSIDVRDQGDEQSFAINFEPVDLEAAMRDILNK